MKNFLIKLFIVSIVAVFVFTMWKLFSLPTVEENPEVLMYVVTDNDGLVVREFQGSNLTCWVEDGYVVLYNRKTRLQHFYKLPAGHTVSPVMKP